MSLPSVMQHNFSKIPAPEIQRSTFDRSHGHKTTFDSGYLVPILIDEILPGDTVKMNATFFGRLSTLIFPIMDNIYLDTFWFYCPARLLWDNWEKFNGAQESPDDSVDYEIPVLEATETDLVDAGDIFDYFGIPLGLDVNDTDVSALPLRMYNRVWQEWFRDENLQSTANVITGDGPDDIINYSLLKRGKRHDYFTSCLPWPQKGEAVSMPFIPSLQIPVRGNGITLGLTNNAVGMGLYANTNGFGEERIIGNTGAYNQIIGGWTPNTANDVASTNRIGLTTTASESGVIADLTDAVSATINDLRQAYAFQSVLERDARGGTRYVEHLKAHWGVTSPDFRLQRPEYLGGGSQRININGVPQTSETDTTPQGTLSAYADIQAQSGFNRSFVEHGYILGLANVRADITYQQGLRKLWSRATRFDFYLPALANLGEQAVLNKEIFHQGTSTDNLVFGYQERWAEMRYFPSQITGLFRSNAVNTLDRWHLSQDFSGLPVLNSSFIEDSPPISRITALDDGTYPNQQILLDCYFKMMHTRPMPVYSIPAGMGRF